MASVIMALLGFTMAKLLDYVGCQMGSWQWWAIIACGMALYLCGVWHAHSFLKTK